MTRQCGHLFFFFFLIIFIGHNKCQFTYFYIPGYFVTFSYSASYILLHFSSNRCTLLFIMQICLSIVNVYFSSCKNCRKKMSFSTIRRLYINHLPSNITVFKQLDLLLNNPNIISSSVSVILSCSTTSLFHHDSTDFQKPNNPLQLIKKCIMSSSILQMIQFGESLIFN